MPKGGARTRSGPAPDPTALRRERATDGDWLLLPATITDPAPDFPLPAPTPRELEIWVRLWALPQAFAWRLYTMEDQVGLYTRRWAEAERPDSPAALSTLVRQMADALGITIPGMHSLRWRLPAAPVETHATTRSGRSTAAGQGAGVVTDLRSRLKAAGSD